MKGEGKDKAYHDKLGEDTEVSEDVDEVQDRSVAWPYC